MYFRNDGDFYALKPPQNDEVEILGYFYNQKGDTQLQPQLFELLDCPQTIYR